MSETTDTYTVSFKSGVGYDAALVVVRGNTVPELEDNIKALHEGTLGLVAETASLLLGAAVVNAPAPVATVTALPSAEQVEAPAWPGTERYCPHGKRTKRNGVSAKGPWTGYFCALPKGTAGACKAEFE